MDLIQIFQRTMVQCNRNPELKDAIETSVKEQKVIFESDALGNTTRNVSKGPATQYLSARRSFAAARQHAKEGKHVCVLNFASFVTPGGGVTRGSKAQEEGLCRISTLYPALIADTAAPFYKAHRAAIENGTSTRKNNDDCIYTPNVKVICEDSIECNELPQNEWYVVDVITCAAPDQRWASQGMFCPTSQELYDVMVKRISRIYAIAATHNVDVLIMGAFGCGVFGNSPDVMASVFEAVTEDYKNNFECVEYAITNRHGDSPNYLAFKKIKGIIEREIY